MTTVLNKSGESRHPCLAPDLKGNTFSFCPLSMMLAVGLLHMASVEVCSLYPHLLLVFIKNEYWISSNAFPAFIDKIM